MTILVYHVGASSEPIACRQRTNVYANIIVRYRSSIYNILFLFENKYFNCDSYMVSHSIHCSAFIYYTEYDGNEKKPTKIVFSINARWPLQERLTKKSIFFGVHSALKQPVFGIVNSHCRLQQRFRGSCCSGGDCFELQ